LLNLSATVRRMNTIELRIKDGPTKPDLQWAVSYPDRHIHMHFDTVEDAVDAHVDAMDEQPNGTTFVLTGHLVSGLYKGWLFRAEYDLESKAGILHATEPRAQA
jgi:hypothetical protein